MRLKARRLRHGACGDAPGRPGAPRFPRAEAWGLSVLQTGSARAVVLDRKEQSPAVENTVHSRTATVAKGAGHRSSHHCELPLQLQLSPARRPHGLRPTPSPRQRLHGLLKMTEMIATPHRSLKSIFSESSATPPAPKAHSPLPVPARRWLEPRRRSGGRARGAGEVRRQLRAP